MTIYTRLGAPCEIVEVREVPVWRVERNRGSVCYRIDIERKKPTKLGKRDKITAEFDLTEVRIRRTGPYPDGSGGPEAAHADTDWYELSFICADGAWPEISKAIEALKQKEAA